MIFNKQSKHNNTIQRYYTQYNIQYSIVTDIQQYNPKQYSTKQKYNQNNIQQYEKKNKKLTKQYSSNQIQRHIHQIGIIQAILYTMTMIFNNLI